jgi:hypothetical protein
MPKKKNETKKTVDPVDVADDLFSIASEEVRMEAQREYTHAIKDILRRKEAAERILRNIETEIEDFKIRIKEDFPGA